MKLIELLRTHVLPVLIGLGIIAFLAFQGAAYFSGKAQSSGTALTKRQLREVWAQLTALQHQQVVSARAADSLKAAVHALEPQLTHAHAATGRALKKYHAIPLPTPAADAATYEYLRTYRSRPDSAR